MKTRLRKPPKPLERDIQKAGMTFLRSLGWSVFRRNTGAVRASYKGRERLVRFSEPGMADCWAVLPTGVHAEIEFKRPGEWPTPAQLVWLRGMNGVGAAVAFWVDSLRDLEAVARHVMGGGRIEFNDEGSYRLVGGKYGE